MVRGCGAFDDVLPVPWLCLLAAGDGRVDDFDVRSLISTQTSGTRVSNDTHRTGHTSHKKSVNDVGIVKSHAELAPDVLIKRMPSKEQTKHAIIDENYSGSVLLCDVRAVQWRRTLQPPAAPMGAMILAVLRPSRSPCGVARTAACAQVHL